MKDLILSDRNIERTKINSNYVITFLPLGPFFLSSPKQVYKQVSEIYCERLVKCIKFLNHVSLIIIEYR